MGDFPTVATLFRASGVICWSASGDGRDDGDGFAGRNRGIEALQIAHVVVRHEHVDELTQSAGVVEQTLTKAGVRSFEVVQHLAEGFAFVGVARPGGLLIHNGAEVGTVASGTFGPSVNKAIGMAYVPVALAVEGTALTIRQGARELTANVCKMPFFKKHAVTA